MLTLFAIFSLYPSWDWYKLPQAYLESAYLRTDQQSLDNFFKQSVDNDNKECKLDFLDKDDDPVSDTHNMDVPTSTTDVNGLDGEENYLNPLPRHEVCLVVFDYLLPFLCVYCVTEKCCFVEKVWYECKDELESS